jgi:hypothetical protein
MLLTLLRHKLCINIAMSHAFAAIFIGATGFYFAKAGVGDQLFKRMNGGIFFGWIHECKYNKK